MNNQYFLYIHIPFCEGKCKYCRFASVGLSQKLQIDNYVKYLIKEINTSKIKGQNLRSIYFGGGTPSILDKTQIKNILNTLKNNNNFAPQIEITLETTPINITKTNLINWSKLGINRLSIGIQTLNEQSLNNIGRGNKGDIINALNILNECNNNFNISLDFIIGLPYVKKGEIEKNIDFVLKNFDININHISVYMLEDYYNESKILKIDDSKYEQINYPSDWKNLGIAEKDFLGEYKTIKKYLKNNGFFRYEISNFAKKGYECKHNMAYWNHSEILAFGLGASSFLSGIRYKNSEEFKSYYNNSNIFKDILTPNDIFLEKLIFGIRTNGISKELYQKLDQEKLENLIKSLYLTYKKNKELLVLKDKGILVLDYILREIL